jgi:hypothetical protein
LTIYNNNRWGEKKCRILLTLDAPPVVVIDASLEALETFYRKGRVYGQESFQAFISSSKTCKNWPMNWVSIFVSLTIWFDSILPRWNYTAIAGTGF